MNSNTSPLSPFIFASFTTRHVEMSISVIWTILLNAAVKEEKLHEFLLNLREWGSQEFLNNRVISTATVFFCFFVFFFFTLNRSDNLTASLNAVDGLPLSASVKLWFKGADYDGTYNFNVVSRHRDKHKNLNNSPVVKRHTTIINLKIYILGE